MSRPLMLLLAGVVLIAAACASPTAPNGHADCDVVSGSSSTC